MALPLYLAMTAAEIQANSTLPDNLGYMACHFSPYGTGLCNFPTALPEGAMLILNDRIPCCGHDPQLICHQLAALVEKFGCSCVLLDFQRPGIEETAAMAGALADALPCSVGISEPYAADLSCPVFLPPVLPDCRLRDYLAPWAGREIWLEAALEGLCLILTETGCKRTPLPYPPSDGGILEEVLHCRYTIRTDPDAAYFTLWRSREDLLSLLTEAESLGVTRAVGLWQELNCRES